MSAVNGKYNSGESENQKQMEQVVDILKTSLKSLNEVIAVMSRTESCSEEVVAVENAMRLIFMQMDKISENFLGSCAEDLDIGSKFKQHDWEVMGEIEARLLLGHVKDDLISRLQNENKELRAKLVVFDDEGKTVKDLEEAERANIITKVNALEEEVIVLKEYVDLTKREIARNESGWQTFSEKTVCGIRIIEENIAELERKSKTRTFVEGYGMFLSQIQNIFDEAVRGVQDIPTSSIRRSIVLQKAIKDAIEVATYVELAQIYQKLTGEEVLKPDDPLNLHAQIADLESMLYLKYEEQKSRVDEMTLKVMDMSKMAAVLQKSLEATQLHNQELQDIIDARIVSDIKSTRMNSYPDDDHHGNRFKHY